MATKKSATVKPQAKAPAKPSYHHGDLPRALIAAATQLIEAGGGARLTLRAAALAAGVSVAAPYRHFADREALLAATLAQGFNELALVTEGARQAATEPIQALVETGLAYVRFAAEKPHTYRLMFGPECDKTNYPDLMEAGHAALAVLHQAVADCQAAGLIGALPVEQVALAGWAITHGLASLHADGLLPDTATATALDRTSRAVVEMLIHGVLTRPPRSPAARGSLPPEGAAFHLGAARR